MNGASRRRINRFLKDHAMDGIKPKKRCEEAAILDCIGDGVMMIGLDMRVRYMNRAMRELLGYEQGEAQRRRCRSGATCWYRDRSARRTIVLWNGPSAIERR